VVVVVVEGGLIPLLPFDDRKRDILFCIFGVRGGGVVLSPVKFCLLLRPPAGGGGGGTVTSSTDLTPVAALNTIPILLLLPLPLLLPCAPFDND